MCVSIWFVASGSFFPRWRVRVKSAVPPVATENQAGCPLIEILLFSGESVLHLPGTVAHSQGVRKSYTLLKVDSHKQRGARLCVLDGEQKAMAFCLVPILLSASLALFKI